MSTSKQQRQRQLQQLQAQQEQHQHQHQHQQGHRRLSRVGHSCLLFLLFLLLSLLGDHQHWAASGSSIVEPEEAAFQGHCGHTSPCEQLCYEIHDGMYECDCIEGYELNKNGYSCQVINMTSSGADGHGKSDEDVLYQKGASFSAKLANDRSDIGKTRYPVGADTSEAAADTNLDSADADSDSNSDSTLDLDADNNSDNYDYNDDNLDGMQQQQQQQQQKVNSNDYYISAESISFNSENEKQELDAADFKVASTASTTTSTPRSTATTATPTTVTTVATSTSTSKGAQNNVVDYEDDREVDGDVDEYYTYKSDMSIYDDVNNNQLNLRRNGNSNSNSHTYQMNSNSNSNSNSNKNNNRNRKNNIVAMHITKSAANSNIISEKTTPGTTLSSTLCNLDCGTEGICAFEATSFVARCLCPFGKTGNGCVEDITAHVPRFAKRSWVAFAALHGAYKHVQLRLEFRPESFDGIILLSGERDDLTGDFMALLLNKGFVEFWFDCGSGVGSVRSRETIMLNEWNSVIIYRHRWDAWMVLNHGTKVQGRSNGLFSRITFREPVFLGGIGNITGLAKRLPLADGFAGCIRRFVANEHDYKFTEHPLGDVINGFDIQDCSTDKCVRYPCQHGGKCLPSDQGAVCLCPIGFVGDLCEIRMDLQVPSFNGSSFLRYAPIGNSALIWLELKVILKPEQSDGLILYSGPEHQGDFIALYLLDGFVEFAFDLGSGPAVVRSEHSLSLGQWHTIKISRTARLAVLKIDQHQEVMTISSNGFWHLSLAQNLFVGGVNHVDHLPLDLKYKSFFMGCIQRIDINGHSLGIVAEALGGSNIGNCPHACVARPCGPLAECVPQMESYECRCSIYNERCNKAAEVPPDLMPELLLHKSHNGKPLEGKQYKGVDSTSSSLPPALLPKKLWMYKKHATKHKNLHKHKTTPGTPTTPTTTSTTTTTTTTAAPITTTAFTLGAGGAGGAGAPSNEEIEDDIIFRFMHENAGMQNTAQRAASTERQRAEEEGKQQLKLEKQSRLLDSRSKHVGKQHVSKHEHHQKPNAFTHKLSRLPTHYESFQTNPDSDILTFDDNNDWVASLQQQEYADAMATSQMGTAQSSSLGSTADDNADNVNRNSNAEADSNEDTDLDADADASGFVFDESLFDATDGTEDYQRKQLAQDMKRIMSNTHTNAHTPKQEPEQTPHVATEKQYSEDYSDDELLTPVLKSQFEPGMPSAAAAAASSTPQTHTDWSLLKKFDLSAEHQSQVQSVRKNFGACFAGIDSYFHYNDAETMSQVISYNIDLNLRIKTHSDNGIILWTGRQGTTEEHDDYLSLGIEKGYLHFRYDLGAGELDIHFNGTKISDGLWHRVRAIRNSQEGYLEVDGRKTMTLRAPGKLRQLNTDTGLYVGGMPDVAYFTHQRYFSGIIGCISEIVLAGDKLNFDPNTLGMAHNVETGLL